MNPRPDMLKPCEVPGKASVEDGVVLLDGPDGVAVSMTPEAAAGTADSLREAAALARATAAELKPSRQADREPN